MTTEEVERIVLRTPFVPYKLLLADGGEVVVKKPRKANVSGDILAVSGVSRPTRNSIAVQGLCLVRVGEIAAAEELDVPA